MRTYRFMVATLAGALLASLAAAQAPTAPMAAAASNPANYVIDTVHSELSFRIRHLLGRVAGTFGNWGGPS